MINWKVRVKHPAFWLALVPAVLLLVQVLAAPFGYTLDLTGLEEDLVAIVNAVFTVLAILGIVVDPTTEGLTDSLQAMEYGHPRTIDEQIGITPEKAEKIAEKIGGTE